MGKRYQLVNVDVDVVYVVDFKALIGTNNFLLAKWTLRYSLSETETD